MSRRAACFAVRSVVCDTEESWKSARKSKSRRSRGAAVRTLTDEAPRRTGASGCSKSPQRSRWPSARSRCTRCSSIRSLGRSERRASVCGPSTVARRRPRSCAPAATPKPRVSSSRTSAGRRSAIPALDCLRTGEPLFISSTDELIARYPHLQGAVSPGRSYRIACMPLLFQGRVLGGLGLTIDEPGAVSDAERDSFLLIARCAGQARNACARSTPSGRAVHRPTPPRTAGRAQQGLARSSKPTSISTRGCRVS